MHRNLTTTVVLILSLAFFGQTWGKPATLTLKVLDQWGNPLEFPQGGKPALLVIFDREAAADRDRWLTGLRPVLNEFPNWRLIPVAHTKGAPGFIKGLIKRSLQKGEAGLQPVAMDWSGQVAQTVGYPGQSAGLYWLDAKGRVKQSLTGVATPKLLKRATGVFQKLASKK